MEDSLKGGVSLYDSNYTLELLKRLNDDFDQAKGYKSEFEYFSGYLKKYFEAHKQGDKSISLIGTGVAVGYANKIVNHIIANSVNKSSRWMRLQCDVYNGVAEDFKKGINTIIQNVQEYLYGIFSNANTRFYCAIESAIRDCYIYGTTCVQIKYSPKRNGLVFINVPMDGMFFDTDEDGAVNQIFREIRVNLRQAYDMWGDALHENQLRELRDFRGNHRKECVYREYIVSSRYYLPIMSEEVSKGFEYIRIVEDTQNKHIVAYEPLSYMPYTVSRFFAEAGSVYGGSLLMAVLRTVIEET